MHHLLKVCGAQGVLGAATEQGGGALESASATLAALGPTWFSAGQTAASLLALVIGRLAAMQPLQRLPLLTATLQGLPQVCFLLLDLARLLCCMQLEQRLVTQ